MLPPSAREVKARRQSQFGWAGRLCTVANRQNGLHVRPFPLRVARESEMVCDACGGKRLQPLNFETVPNLESTRMLLPSLRRPRCKCADCGHRVGGPIQQMLNRFLIE